MIAPEPMDLGPGARNCDVEAEFVLGLREAGKCPFGIVAILVEANGPRYRAARREHGIAPADREVCAGGIIAGSGLPIKRVGSRFLEPAMVDEDRNIASPRLEG
ncbi:hypothetical protein [Mesorhizobium sp. M0019]|uniref:hypothetical protein n=1 Tax=Mesorhizobium sp. M0019 TaxID=2956845 RepID=UPI003339991C